MSMPLSFELFDAPVLFVEARYCHQTLCARILSPRSPRGFTVGGARRADAPVDLRYLPAGHAANDNHTLIAPRGAGFAVNLSPAMRALARRTPDGLRIPCGEVVFDISSVAPPPRVPRSWLRPGWRADARVTAAVALGTLLLLVLVRAVPSDPHALSLDDVGRTVRMDAFRILPPVTVEPAPAKSARGPSAAGGAQAAATGPAGVFGDPRARPADTRRATKGPATKQDARAVETYVRTSTLLSILDGQRTGAVAAVFDRTPALGAEALTVLSRLEGTDFADALGAHGLGQRGTGTGGAGTGDPMLGGPRGLHTIGLRPGPGGSGLDDHGPATLGPRTARGPDIMTTPPIVRGGLDKEIVRRIVRQHLNEVRFCYEEALARQPTLAGRVVAMFTIAPNGTVAVSALQSSTVSAPTVGACVVAATRRWLFPQPEHGGLVTVSYPFQFAPAGG